MLPRRAKPYYDSLDFYMKKYGTVPFTLFCDISSQNNEVFADRIRKHASQNLKNAWKIYQKHDNSLSEYEYANDLFCSNPVDANFCDTWAVCFLMSELSPKYNNHYIPSLHLKTEGEIFISKDLHKRLDPIFKEKLNTPGAIPASFTDLFECIVEY